MTAEDLPTPQGDADKKSTLEAPPGYRHGAIAAPKIVDVQSEEPQPSPPALGADDARSEARAQFVGAVHQYIRENIQFVDQKATFFATGATALLAFLYNQDLAEAWMKPLMQWNLLDLAAFVAMAGLAIGTVLALVVVRPRTPGSRRGFVFWEAIAEYDTARQYADDVAQLTPATLSQSIAEHCHDLSRVCRVKYKYLRCSIYSCSAGLLASICVFMFAGFDMAKVTSRDANEQQQQMQPDANKTRTGDPGDSRSDGSVTRQ